MPQKVLFFVPLQAAAILSIFSVMVTFGMGAAVGWYIVYATHNVASYESKPMRAQMFAGILGTFATAVVCVSFYGLFAVLSRKAKTVLYCLWSSWLTFFLACTALAAFDLLLWLDNAWNIHDCKFNSSDMATSCQGPSLSVKIVVTLVGAFGLVVQLYLTKVVRWNYEKLQHLQDEAARKEEASSQSSSDQRSSEPPAAETEQQLQEYLHVESHNIPPLINPYDHYEVSDAHDNHDRPADYSHHQSA